MSLTPSDITNEQYYILVPCCAETDYETPVLTTTLSGMRAGESQPITISGGCSPYTWTTSAPFSFEYETTTTVSNTLYLAAGGSGDETVDITIQDACYIPDVNPRLDMSAGVAYHKVTGEPWAVFFYVSTNDCFRDDQVNEVDLMPSHTITQATTVWGVGITGTNPVYLDVPFNRTLNIPVFTTQQAVDYEWSDGSDVYGQAHVVIPYCECEEDPSFAWDTGVSPSSMSPSSSVTIGVTGINAPFHWSVEGFGFALTYPRTAGNTNTLASSALACGAAIITVHGCDGQKVVGTVNCTTGTWVLLPGDAGYCYDVPENLSHYVFEVTSGAYKVTGREYCGSDGPSVNACCGFCQDLFNICSYCSGFDPDRVANTEQFCYQWGCVS